jgi:hypothetical protein
LRLAPHHEQQPVLEPAHAAAQPALDADDRLSEAMHHDLRHKAWCGKAGRGIARRGKAWCGMAGLGRAWQGIACQGKAMAWRGVARRGRAWCGMAGLGNAWQRVPGHGDGRARQGEARAETRAAGTERTGFRALMWWTVATQFI